ncbi:hypothetical protein SMACR_02322 [Sordaria macrospora]|uniref:WGS project CABT00000000 data, contig 2.3 n=2 Tax=Sordaria macrospora TaxID=5147 RepID=F7VP85_SORMK|nr:uncharacterized protein SMAC_02322 [Sordaria macrospora k-hell]KAA8634120.1 hypothetical protein SMACR_02322 [Sordaria macrospora]CCC07313.1 unnamed protein product [Sordaria macrospora k-hell]
MSPPNGELSGPSRAAVLQEIEDMDEILGGGPFPTFRGRAASNPRPDAQGQARGPERQVTAPALAIRQRSRTPSRPQRARGLSALAEESAPPMPGMHSAFWPPNPPFAQPGFDGGRPNRSRSGTTGPPLRAPPRGFVLPATRQPPRDVRSPSGGQHMGQPVLAAPAPPPIPPRSAQRQQQDNRCPSASGSRPTMSLNQAAPSRSSLPVPAPQPQASRSSGPRSSQGDTASSSSRLPVQTPPYEVDDGKEVHPFRGRPPTGSRPRPTVALPSQSLSPGASGRAGTRRPSEPGYFDQCSLPPPALQVQTGESRSGRVVSPAEPSPAASATTTNFGYHPMMSPYEAEAASGLARAWVESPNERNSGTPGGDHWAQGHIMLSPVEAAVACADNRRTTIFMDMGVQYADDHEKEGESGGK